MSIVPENATERMKIDILHKLLENGEVREAVLQRVKNYYGIYDEGDPEEFDYEKEKAEAYRMMEESGNYTKEEIEKWKAWFEG